MCLCWHVKLKIYICITFLPWYLHSNNLTLNISTNYKQFIIFHLKLQVMLKIKTAQIYWRKINSGQLKGRAKEKSYAKILLFFINTKYSFSILEQILFTQNVFQWFKHSCNLLNISVFHIWTFIIRIKKRIC